MTTPLPAVFANLYIKIPDDISPPQSPQSQLNTTPITAVINPLPQKSNTAPNTPMPSLSNQKCTPVRTTLRRCNALTTEDIQKIKTR